MLFRFLRFVAILCLCMSCLICAPMAQAQVVLKPNGRNAVPLRTKAIQANIAIEGQHAVNKLLLTFQNETSERIEADFIYTLPPNTLVTTFAYWYGEEKVVARVVEKQEAAAIYRHITTRMRDPALVEMVGKNSFRARIFPVMPNSDLKVEMTLAQTLPSDAQGATYMFPLKMPRDTSLDAADVHVHVASSRDVTRVTNNNGLTVTHNAYGYDMRLHGANYRPQKDLQVRLHRPSAPLHAALYAAPSTYGKDGFFALVLTPDCLITDPVVRVEGVKTYQVVYEDTATIRANHAYTLVGRYQGGGKARVILTGMTSAGGAMLTQALRFSTHPIANNPASKLWAAAYIARLSADKSHRDTIIALSKRYGMPSRFTSWLAVPHEEMQRYDKEIAEAKIEPIAHLLAEEMLNNRANSRKARSLQAQLRALARKAGQDPSTALDNYFEYRYNHVGETLSDLYIHHAEHTREARKLRQELDRIQQFKHHEGEYTDNIAFWVVHQKLQALGQKLTTQFPKSSDAAQTRAEMERLARLTRMDVKDYLFEGNSSPGFSARQGDPLLSIEAPQSAQQVIAILPGGEIKRLTYNVVSRHWEARFDIPMYATEGAYAIKIVIVLADGTRTMQVFRYRVDVTPPTGSGRAQTVISTHRILRLELEASADTARVKALLPWGEPIALQPGSQPHIFFALVPLPSDSAKMNGSVTYILTDKAHNRTAITVDMEK